MEIFRFVFSPIDVNTYVLANETGECAIIDCGCYDEKEFERLSGFLQEKNLQPVLLLNTHCHLDHIFGNKFILERYSLKTYYNELDEKNRNDSVSHAKMFGLKMDYPPEPAGYITDGQVVRFGDTELIALHVPGHSAGSMAFYCEKEASVFTGDALFAGSIGRTDLPAGNYETLIDSIREKLFTLPPSTVVYPGHGTSTTIKREIETNPYFS